uniref:Putative conserved secreted protein n=1 Tax=Aedes albopictus TaxID=7160 RepID=A0A1W7R7J1_AEDAL
MSSKVVLLASVIIASLFLLAEANDGIKLTEFQSPEIRNPARVRSSGSSVHSPQPHQEGPEPQVPEPEGPQPDIPESEDPKPEGPSISESHAEVHESNTNVETEQQRIETPQQ